MQYKRLLARTTTWLIPVIILGVGIGIFFLLINRPSAEGRPKPASQPPLVTTVPIERHEGDLEFRVDGTVVPYRQIDLSAEVSGKIIYKAEACRSGKYVEQGTLLIQVDPRDYELEVDRLTSRLNEADANLAELEVEIANAQSLIELAEEEVTLQRLELQRLQGLSEGRAAVAQSELDQAKQAELAARNSRLTLQNQIQLLQARRSRLNNTRELAATELEKAELDLQRTKIHAPLDGVIAGDLVEQESYVQRGAQLLTIEDTSAVEVQCSLREEELYWLWSNGGQRGGEMRSGYEIPETPVTVVYRLNGRKGVKYTWQGVLSRYEQIGLDEQTRTATCRVLVQQPRVVQTTGSQTAPPALVRGMYVTVEVHVAPSTTLVRIPERAVRPGKSVWLNRRGRLEIHDDLRLIELLDIENSEGSSHSYWLADAEASRLQAGDRVIVSPLVSADEGTLIREQTGGESGHSLGDS